MRLQRCSLLITMCIATCTYYHGTLGSTIQCVLQYYVIFISYTCIYSYPMFNMASTTLIPDAHITTDDNLAYGIHPTRSRVTTVDNPVYNTHTHTSSTKLPAPPQPSMDMSTIHTNIDPAYESPVSISTTDPRPPALLPSSASTADATQRLSTWSTDQPMPLQGEETHTQHSGSDNDSNNSYY